MTILSQEEPAHAAAARRLAQLRRGAQHRVRDHWRQPHPRALDVSAAPSDAAGREADGEAASLLLTAAWSMNIPSPRSTNIVTAG